MNIIIRRAMRADIPALIRLNVAQADYHAKFDRFFRTGRQIKPSLKSYLEKEFRKRSSKMFVAEADGEIVGYLFAKVNSLSPVSTLRRVGHIGGTFVASKHRNHGVATKLIKEAMRWFKAEELKAVELSVTSNNKLGVDFWTKQGFKEVQKKMRMRI